MHEIKHEVDGNTTLIKTCNKEDDAISYYCATVYLASKGVVKWFEDGNLVTEKNVEVAL